MPEWASYSSHHPALLLFCGSAWPLYAATAEVPEAFRTGGSERYLLPDEWSHRYARDPGEDREARRQREVFFGRSDDHRDDWTATRVAMEGHQERLAGVPMGEDVLIGLAAPCALIIPKMTPDRQSGVQLIANPRLADHGFLRIMDPYACFQAIETFLGNQLAPPDLAPQRVGSDEIVARQKGFDAQSFRTAAPGHKKENRAANRLRKRGA